MEVADLLGDVGDGGELAGVEGDGVEVGEGRQFGDGRRGGCGCGGGFRRW